MSRISFFHIKVKNSLRRMTSQTIFSEKKSVWLIPLVIGCCFFLGSAVVKIFIPISWTPRESLTWFFRQHGMVVKIADSGTSLPKFQYLFCHLTVWLLCVEQGILCWIIPVLLVWLQGQSPGGTLMNEVLFTQPPCLWGHSATFSKFFSLSTSQFPYL